MGATQISNGVTHGVCNMSPYLLPTIDFVGGVSEDLMFNVYYNADDPEPFNLTGCSANFSIVNYMNKTGKPMVSKSMSIRLNEEGTIQNVLYVSLAPADTVDLAGKYIYQISVRDIDSNADIPHQGIIYIHNNINKDFLR